MSAAVETYDDRVEAVARRIRADHDLVPMSWCRMRARKLVELADRAGLDPLADWPTDDEKDES